MTGRAAPPCACACACSSSSSPSFTLKLTLTFVLALLAGCVGARCPKQLITDPRAALASRHYDAGSIHSLRAEAKVDQRGKQGRVKGRVLMFVERPNHVRFDAMTQFGPALVLTSDGETFALSDYKEKRFLSGPACAPNIARLVGVAISGEAVTRVLLGDLPELEAAHESVACSGSGGYQLERLDRDGSRQSLELVVAEHDLMKPPAQQRSELRAVTFWDRNKVRLYRVRYEDYRPVSGAGVRLPFTVRIEDFRNGSDAVLRFQSIDLNVRVPEGAFIQTARAGLRLEQVDCE